MEIIKYLDTRLVAYRGLIEREELREINCPHCKEPIQNFEYTKGMVIAFDMVKEFVNGNRRSKRTAATRTA
jgi:hypothetical protein